ncbi:GTPase [Streptomyces sp. WMMC905]|uniref:GTPase n=1 Tax=Streptomyces sp. WMMC905 TaxID=3404123 RepID=UPI003B93266A
MTTVTDEDPAEYPTRGGSVPADRVPGDRRGEAEGSSRGSAARSPASGAPRRDREEGQGCSGRASRRGHDTVPAAGSGSGDTGAAWNDGLIARRMSEPCPVDTVGAPEGGSADGARGALPAAAPASYSGPLGVRLEALRELVGLSRTRLDAETLAEAGRVLDEASARRGLSGEHTVVAIAGATGSGKSQLFNALVGASVSETGVRRPTTAAPVACGWSDGAAGLLDRLGVPGRLRRRPVPHPDADSRLRGLVLVDLPDHDSAAVRHREQVDRVLALVDAVIWVVDPEKYADAALHERYLRPMADHAEVTFVVLNQVDRLPGEAAEQVLDDLRRLLDEDGVALGEHGERGATVLALSALTGEGLGELREALGQFVAERGASERRLAADVDAAARGLRPAYVTGRGTGLTEEAREEFAERLAEAVGAEAVGVAAERAWRRRANRACGTPWLRFRHARDAHCEEPAGEPSATAGVAGVSTARQGVEQAVRRVVDRAVVGLPPPWERAVRDAAARGAEGLPEALDEIADRAETPVARPPRPGWWPLAVTAQAATTLLQVVGAVWLSGWILGVFPPGPMAPVLLMAVGLLGGPLVEWGCRLAARGPARRYGEAAERLVRDAAAGCGRARVLDPVAAELLRYREVRERYARVVGQGPG